MQDFERTLALPVLHLLAANDPLRRGTLSSSQAPGPQDDLKTGFWFAFLGLRSSACSYIPPPLGSHCGSSPAPIRMSVPP